MNQDVWSQKKKRKKMKSNECFEKEENKKLLSQSYVFKYKKMKKMKSNESRCMVSKEEKEENEK